MALTNKALIVSLNISQWTGRKKDTKASNKVETTFKTGADVGLYTKRLLPKCAELREVGRLASGIRQYFYENTLPWLNDGSRIISSKAYLDFVNEFRKRKGEFDNAVDALLKTYPSQIAKAEQQLGKLHNEGDYPTAYQLRSYYDCEISFLPVPDVGDFRVEVLDTEKDSFLKNMADIESRAMKECWHRLFDVVEKAAHRLNSSDAIIRDSLIENVREMCQVLPKLNITDDPELERMRQATEGVIAGISTANCRDNKAARTDAAKALEDITAKMGAFMGLKS